MHDREVALTTKSTEQLSYEQRRIAMVTFVLTIFVLGGTLITHFAHFLASSLALIEIKYRA